MRATRSSLLSIGSVSSGTMRNADLIPAFRSALEDCRNALEIENVGVKGFDAQQASVKTIARLDRLLSEAETIEASDTEDADGVVSDLFDALGEFCPPYCYFGAIEGDGSDYGCWPSMDSVEDSCRDGSMVKVSDLSEVEDGYVGEVCIVNDHGNVTVGSIDASGEFREAWSCV